MTDENQKNEYVNINTESSIHKEEKKKDQQKRKGRNLNKSYNSNTLADEKHYNLGNLSQREEEYEDPELLALKHKLNEMKKERMKSEKKATVLENKVIVLHKEEEKVNGQVELEMKKNTELTKKKSYLNKIRAELTKARMKNKEAEELNKQKINEMKQKLTISKKIHQFEFFEKKQKKAKEVFKERKKLIEQKNATITEIEEEKKGKVNMIKEMIESAVEEAREENKAKKENLKKNLNKMLLEEEEKAKLLNMKIETLVKEESEIKAKVFERKPLIESEKEKKLNYKALKTEGNVEAGKETENYLNMAVTTNYTTNVLKTEANIPINIENNITVQNYQNEQLQINEIQTNKYRSANKSPITHSTKSSDKKVTSPKKLKFSDKKEKQEPKELKNQTPNKKKIISKSVKKEKI